MHPNSCYEVNDPDAKARGRHHKKNDTIDWSPLQILMWKYSTNYWQIKSNSISRRLYAMTYGVDPRNAKIRILIYVILIQHINRIKKQITWSYQLTQKKHLAISKTFSQYKLPENWEYRKLFNMIKGIN